ncbi:LutC/YkgG family protein [Natronoflexus pectinivorans]|uniref:L-lactate dehydrogenase complex protein LldG n=1 Tax=Natronoflexus pectinivorans TaxID=682526 RepID=A0A4R2GMR8_9BACT|nr:LUD domain-containing protein [Natronoflexus pectinivorans]TCO10572.1 L-lactate dehydrogenase complex protein LldG [Natronoflexus pectinivorans]
MADNNAKENILSRLRSAPSFKWSVSPGKTGETDPFPTPDNLIEAFQKELTEVSGEFKQFSSIEDAVKEIVSIAKELSYDSIWCSIENISQKISQHGIELNNSPETPLAVAGCEHLISTTGSVFASSYTGPGRQVYVSAETLIIIAYETQLVPQIKDALQNLQKNNHKPSWTGLITGPSRTADIEKTLVLGAHGPRHLIVFLISKTTQPQS